MRTEDLEPFLHRFVRLLVRHTSGRPFTIYGDVEELSASTVHLRLTDGRLFVLDLDQLLEAEDPRSRFGEGGHR